MLNPAINSDTDLHGSTQIHLLDRFRSSKNFQEGRKDISLNLACYIIRASFSQERMTYIAVQDSLDGIAKVIYESKDGKTSKTFEALNWLAQLVTHIPNKGE